MSNTTILDWVTVILALGAFLQPMFFGVLFLFMFKHFPTRRETELQNKLGDDRHSENLQKFDKLFELIEEGRK